MSLFGQHELGRAREWIEAAFGEGAELELAVAIGEVREHKVRQPVGRRLVKRLQDARVVRVAAAPREQLLGLLAAVATEMLVQQVHHRPKMPAFFHVDLEQVAQVVLARRRQSEMALLLNGRWFGVALSHDDAAQVGAILAGHVLPRSLALVVAEMDLALFFARIEEDAPTVVRHLHMAELRPALRVDADGGSQIDIEVLRSVWAHVAPPLQKIGLPLLKRPLQRAVLAQVDVVRNLVGVVNRRHDASPNDSAGGIRWCIRGAVEFATEVSTSHFASVRRGSNRKQPYRLCRRPSARPCRRPRWAAGISSSARPSGGRRSG